MAMAFLAFATGGCVEPLDESLKPEKPTLTFWIKVPGSMLATKAENDDVASISPESKIYDVQVWAFAHGATGSDLPLNYVDKDDISFEHRTTTPKNWDDSYKIEMPLPLEFVLEENPCVDFYILANWQSIFTEKPAPENLAGVRDLVFGTETLADAFFGTTNPTTVVPEKGLPISTVYMGEGGNGVSLQFLQDAYLGVQGKTSLSDDVFKAKLGVIELERAVAKIRFAFARPTGMENVQITKIEIDKDLIPNSTYAFPRANGDFALPGTPVFGGVTTLAGTGNNPLLSTDAIKEVALPEALRSTEKVIKAKAGTGKSYAGEKPFEMSAQHYDDFLTDSTTTRLIYLRESDATITGKIYYKLSDDQNDPFKVPFTMTLKDEDDTYTNLHRNHYWTVYAYFQGGNLYVYPTVAPWKNADPLTYTLKMNTNMRLFDSWLYRYDTDGDYTDYTKWATSHMAVSDGRVAEMSEVEPVAGRPLRSPQIQLVTTGVNDPNVANSGTFELRIDNNDFEILRVNKNATTGAVASYAASTNGVLTIDAGDDVYTYFYIVPKDGVTPSNPVAKVSLIYNDPVLGPQKVTFNSNALPGYADDSSEIWAYYFPNDQYNITGKLKMYYQDYDHPLVPTSVQN